jgi:flagellar biosynthesis protein FlhF
MQEAGELAQIAAGNPEIDTHLVLSAAVKSADMAAAADRYQLFAPRKLLFTRIDETTRYGGLISESVRCALPLSFLSTGPQIPDDIEPATKIRLSRLLTSTSSAPLLLSRALKVRGAAA